MMIECSRCGEAKDTALFYARAGSPTGLRPDCKPCVKTSNSESKRRAHKKNPANLMFRNARYRARLAGVPFDITVDDIIVPPTCPVLGIPIQIGAGGHNDASPSLDRINPSKGYVRGNVIVVSWRVNRIKCDASPNELRAIADFYEVKS